ncbi:MAG: isoprenylcysteine carboxylmethyltransferase family protein [Methylococcales bacterium]|mgnify:CR=1 FL=1|jgi:protein-S-isoprenylcysteine O-methyltransferase Ste14|nr:isoprenylcysteine carboxylmethyltransferase family protein [Methylococcales bacterium]MBT7443525.1 isoprenylcysteine carboxylmethyltransferase family protein [Methylococcales bacterium]
MKILHTKIPPPIIALLTVLAMWPLKTVLPLHIFDHPALFYTGIVIICIGLSLDLVSLFNFIKNKTTINPVSPHKAAHLVISGFYRYTRNPMYLGLLLVLTGTAMLFATASAFLLLPLFVIAINTLQIKPEEAALETLFGEQYTHYKSQVNRWI